MEDTLNFRLLIAVQGCAEDGAAVATELGGDKSGISTAEKREDGRVTWLYQPSDLLHEFVGYAELVFPPCGIERAGASTNGTTSSGGCRKSPGRQGSGCAGGG